MANPCPPNKQTSWIPSGRIAQRKANMSDDKIHMWAIYITSIIMAFIIGWFWSDIKDWWK
jgi:hypothetical protein